MSNSIQKSQAIYRAAVQAIQGRTIMEKVIKFTSDGQLTVTNPSNNQQYQFDTRNKKLYIIGAGKAVFGMCVGLLEQLQQSKFELACGILSVPFGQKFSTEDSNLLNRFKVLVRPGATNNVPDQQSLATTEEILKLVETIRADSTRPAIVISLISGGGSALLFAPIPGVELNRKIDIVKQLMRSGCGIESLNKIRSKLSSVKNGNLARRVLSGCEHIEMINLIASDIIGDPIELIGSGPTVINSSTSIDEVLDILNRYHIKANDIEKPIRNYELNTSKSIDEKHNLNLIVVNSEIALKAAEEEAKRFGLRVIQLGRDIAGEAANQAEKFVHIIKDNQAASDSCWLGGGETVVTVDEGCKGIGGRCQEMALSVAVKINGSYPDFQFMAAGTDGQDGPTPVAGAIVDCGQKFDNQQLDKANQALKDHDSYHFWQSTRPEALVDTNGPTGVNVMDIYCLIKAHSKSKM